MENTKPIFDAYIISAISDFDVLEKNIPYIKKNIPAQHIFIVAKEKPSEAVLSGCEFLDENSIIDGMTYKAVSNKILSLGADKKHTGWYFQQFIKLALSKICENQYYLVWDCDTIPLHQINFFDDKNRPYFNLKREYKARYFKTLNNLIGLKKSINESFISEHMMFDANLTNEMLQKIEGEKLEGSNFWEKILSASFRVDEGSERNFSEFETYGTFIENFYKNRYTKRKLNTLRYGAEFFGDEPTDSILSWCSKSLDTISFEKYDYERKPIENKFNFEDMEKTSAILFLKNSQIRDKKDMRKALISFKKEKINLLRRKNIIYEMDFIFSTKSKYNSLTPFVDFLCKKISLLQKIRVLFNILR